ncbi:putative membrane protein [Candidatus Protofrankia californiensis]|uniref:Putative membrane protein n=1 Tax=Candidatus Protofrankia californiensis TaxID=1839754 RepID=A0A1C3P0R4_9ACTN|nr:putative membrane protein [Candidatus Protofrankia californiensis]
MFAIAIGALGTLLSVVLAFSYPLIAPLVAVASIGFSTVRYRHDRTTIWVALAVVSSFALIVAGMIDLGLLGAENTVDTPRGPFPTER